MSKTTKRSISEINEQLNTQDIVTKRPRSKSSNQDNKKKTRKVTTKKKAVSRSRSGLKLSRKVRVQTVSEDIEYCDDPLTIEEDEEDEDCAAADEFEVNALPAKRFVKRVDDEKAEIKVKFVGKPVNHDEALSRWPNRYEKKKFYPASNSKAQLRDYDAEEPIYAVRHYLQAEVDGQLYNLDDDAYVQAEEGMSNYICKIKELFHGEDCKLYFTAQWFYRAEDTVIQNCKELIDARRVFLSEIRNDNQLGCIVQKLTINCLPQGINLEMIERIKSECDYYYDMMYLLPFCSFVSLPSENVESDNQSDSTISTENDVSEPSQSVNLSSRDDNNSEMTLLDLYSGCGAMSTGLSLGSNNGGVKLTTKWAVDSNQHACESLRQNHPETLARHESAANFLIVIKLWESLCVGLSLYESSVPAHPFIQQLTKEEEDDSGDEEEEDDIIVDNTEIFEVEDILDICYGDVTGTKPTGLYFKIHWKGFNEDYDSWEPIDGLSDCPEKLKEFVTRGFENNILPLPGCVDVICGGPPCQGISGYNRFRNTEKPLEDEKNKQLLVYMDIIRHLKPRYVLMENVVDLLKFSRGYLARYAFGSLVGMNYQARLGMMAAGSYGLPQFRMRVFLWGALMHEKLPGYPLPTHKVQNRGVTPKEFEANIVAYADATNVNLKKDLNLGDAIKDLPEIQNDETRDEMPYGDNPKSDFQRFIRQRRGEMPGSLPHDMVPEQHMLYDHRPLRLSKDDYQRVCLIPMKKGANFRNLPGVIVGPDNKVGLAPGDRIKLPSSKNLVPDYALKFVRGTSTKPFGRLWYDEIVSTVMTRAEPHNHVLLHPNQCRVLTIRENARLQGFPDYYKLSGSIKERYIQVGNAVAVPVAAALGYSLALTLRGLSNGEPLFPLLEDYPLFTAEGSKDEEPQV